MRVLALDTTTRALSAAVVDDDRVLAERVDNSSRSHAERLPGDLLAVLDEAGVPLSTIDVFAVAAGPGSFTGLRIGIATMQGLAFVNQRRMVAVSALEALAHAASGDLAPDEVVGVWIDAHRREVFSAVYRTRAAPPFHRDRVVEIDPPAVGTPAATLHRWQSRGIRPGVFIGSGAVLYGEMVAGVARILDDRPLAATIGRLATGRAAAGQAIDPAAVQPLYVRRPDAELARDKEEPQWLRGTSNP
jgi:tRNA threonylcarbamoyladenosine biosynthesis protein TsaB